MPHSSRDWRWLACCVCLLTGVNASAATVTVAWDPNTDHTSGYVLSFGQRSGLYTTILDAGNQTAGEISGLDGNTTYYVAVQAYDAHGSLSGYSEELVVTTADDGTWDEALGLVCPVLTATSSDGMPVAVSYVTPIATGGAAPITTTCSPPSGSLFPLGTTRLACSATDALMHVASCTSVVMVSPLHSPYCSPMARMTGTSTSAVPGFATSVATSTAPETNCSFTAAPTPQGASLSHGVR